MRILVMGLSGTGKTTLARRLRDELDGVHLDADVIRSLFNDWDFSPEARLRSARRMSQLAQVALWHNPFVIADFICPTVETRDIFLPDFIVWMNTDDRCRYEDTNQLFQPPEPDSVDFEVSTKDVDRWLPLIVAKLRNQNVT